MGEKQVNRDQCIMYSCMELSQKNQLTYVSEYVNKYKNKILTIKTSIKRFLNWRKG